MTLTDLLGRWSRTHILAGLFEKSLNSEDIEKARKGFVDKEKGKRYSIRNGRVTIEKRESKYGINVKTIRTYDNGSLWKIETIENNEKGYLMDYKTLTFSPPGSLTGRVNRGRVGR
jgi:hypothetical protein